MKTLLVIPCCKRKIQGGINFNDQLTFFENENNVFDLIERRNQRLTQFEHLLNNNEEYLEAWERYDGTIYRKLKQYQNLIDKLIQNKIIDIVIVSAMYGLINYNTKIKNYDLSMGQLGGVKFWNNGNLLTNSLNFYIAENQISSVYTFLSPNQYYIALFGDNFNQINHEQIWPIGLRGVNKINNQVSESIIEIIIELASEHQIQV
jgi:cytoplasmic iron level regulating protein YaaA (DUF328/UPF0246 family)